MYIVYTVLYVYASVHMRSDQLRSWNLTEVFTGCVSFHWSEHFNSCVLFHWPEQLH